MIYYVKNTIMLSVCVRILWLFICINIMWVQTFQRLSDICWCGFMSVSSLSTKATKACVTARSCVSVQVRLLISSLQTKSMTCRTSNKIKSQARVMVIFDWIHSSHGYSTRLIPSFLSVFTNTDLTLFQYVGKGFISRLVTSLSHTDYFLTFMSSL